MWDQAFRPAPPASTGRNLLKTALQCVVIWGLALGVLPALLVRFEPLLGLDRFHLPGQPALALAAFLAFSTLNVATGGVLAGRGHGTPLPLDCPRDLVISGPYAHVRNPMAVAGLGQGASVGLWLGSWLVLAYALLGAIVWQWLARPAEERDLAQRFGDQYREYQRAVRCWWPRLRAYRPGA
jgi:protein-S-isoprenylcysteine O-methyltransferase Ste14